MNKAVFLDRDGVINKTIFRMGKERAPYTLEEFAIFKGVREATQQLKNAGFLLIVVTNQPDVARGWVSREQVDQVNEQVMRNLPLDDLYACFHTDQDNCLCRKPRPGMLLEAAKKWNIDLSKSFMIGDRLSDVEAGQKAGCKSILVGPQHSEEAIKPDLICADLLEASRFIIR